MPRLPSSTMKYFRVRVDGSSDEVLRDFVKKTCERYILVHHVLPHGNPHYHFYAETRYSQGNYSTMIKKACDVKGAAYSNETCDYDRRFEYFSYLFNTKKGNVPRLVEYEGFSPIDIETYRANAQTIEKEFQAKLKTSKKTQIDVALIVCDRLPEAVHPEVIYDEVIAVLKELRMMARPNHVKDIIATVMAYSGDSRARKTIKDLTLKFFSFQ